MVSSTNFRLRHVRCAAGKKKRDHKWLEWKKATKDNNNDDKDIRKCYD